MRKFTRRVIHTVTPTETEFKIGYKFLAVFLLSSSTSPLHHLSSLSVHHQSSSFLPYISIRLRHKMASMPQAYFAIN